MHCMYPGVNKSLKDKAMIETACMALYHYIAIVNLALLIAILKVWRPHTLIYSKVLFKSYNPFSQFIICDYTRIRAVALTTP